MFNRTVPAAEPSSQEPVVVYRLAAGSVARLAGLGFVMLALVAVAGTLLAAVSGAPISLVLAVLAIVVLVMLSLAWYLLTRAWVLRCTPEAYRVRLVRGVGVAGARWSAVEDAITTTRHGVACVVLRLRDGGTTTIPVGVLATDREQFVRDLQGRLQRGHGLRRL